MSKREDWEILKLLDKRVNNIFSKLPLIYLDNENFIKNMHTAYNSERLSKISLRSQVKNHLDKILFNDFLFYFYDTNSVSHYFRITKRNDSIHIIKPVVDIHSNEEGIKILRININSTNDIVELLPDYAPLSGHLEYLSDEYKESIVEELVKNLSSTLLFFTFLAESDLYPVEIKGTQYRRRPAIAHDKKPWQRSDLVSIVFLNKLPTSDNKPSQGGHHASPCYHQRRGHTRTMKDERFKNHPDYMKPIYRKAVWVGEKETIINGTTYKVL